MKRFLSLYTVFMCSLFISSPVAKIEAEQDSKHTLTSVDTSIVEKIDTISAYQPLDSIIKFKSSKIVIDFDTTKTHKETVTKTEEVIEKSTVLNMKLVDSLLVNNKYFRHFKDLLCFVEYVKTQSNRLDEDNLVVIKVMFNRMDKEQCDWNTYYTTPSINHSNSIKLMRAGKLKKRPKLDEEHDATILDRSIKTSVGYNPLNVPSDILYFESLSKCPNKGIFKRDKIWKKYRHRFYYK